ncbi:sugar transferase [Mesorhizobium sp. Root157]|uniref:sugar transferase n=1 Tax=Mesorhizobium sp. Root157 TaxID=1736477 RepID=UPI001FCD1CD4|nr:sugar transferase [Mesorhizobium sp. Root157]
MSRQIYFGLKRGFDIAATVAVAPVALSLVGALAILVRLDGGRAFYSQPRIGRSGKTFRLWKLRTMVPGAEAKLEQHLKDNPTARIEWDANQKLRHDPRITTIGGFLRKYSLDELPQLLNVFLGQMSLVGPRPMCLDQRSQYPGTAYFELRPGLTGLWQISDRNNCTFTERAMHDTRYARIMSFQTDLQIMVRTVGVVFRGTGL